MDDAWVNEYVWARDSRSLFCWRTTARSRCGEHMFEQPIVRVWFGHGQRRAGRSGADRRLLADASARDGARLAYPLGRGAHDGRRRRARTSRAAARRSSPTSIPSCEASRSATLKPVKWRSFDGMEIWGLLLTPPRCDAGTEAAAARLLPRRPERRRHLRPLSAVHARRSGRSIRIRPKRWRAPASRCSSRCRAAAPDTARRASARSSTRGAKPTTRTSWPASTTSIAQGIADPDRLGVMGASYGGYMTNWIVTQTGRFKAASARRQHQRSHRSVFPLRRRRPDGRVLQASVGSARVVRRALAAHVRGTR